MKFTPTDLAGVMLIEPRVFSDERGNFLETYREDLFASNGILDKFSQDNQSYSKKGVLRGLHFQNPHAQAKLVRVVQGEVWDVAVDIRLDSPNFGKWIGMTLSAENRKMLFVPAGFAHGFLTISDSVEFVYKCSDVYHPGGEATLLWNDPELAIKWPIDASLSISPKDAKGMSLKDYRNYPKAFTKGSFK